MTNLDIKKYYDLGYSGSFIISKKNMTKTQCKNYVYDVIYNFNKEGIELK